ncbi:MAG: hypothetical protein Ct9H90mP13_09120 [Pseudomonadota bacterium]|nr:MAG: hypothetical protein Ct9H90mP13_09120 [Pseudomonadota bacterium]
MRGLNTGTAQVSSGTSNTYMGEISMGMTNLYDVNRIEVLRGHKARYMDPMPLVEH